MIKRTLQELCLNITDGKHGDCENEENSGYYFISCKDIFDGQINYKNARQITKADFEETHKRTMLEVDDILLTNSGTIGRMAFVTDREATTKTTFQKSVAIIKPDKQKVLPRYLYYQLQNCVPQFINSSNGSAQKNLLLSTMRTFQIEIEENREKQEKIADTLSAYDDLIENNQKQIKLLEEAARRLYKEWFVDLHFPGHENTKIVDGVPEGWQWCKVRDVADINSSALPKNYKEDFIDYVDLGSVRCGHIETRTRYNLNEAPGRAKRCARDGDIIWGMVRPNLKAYLEDNLSDSEFSAEVVGRFEKMNDLYRRYEDCSTIYDLFLSDLDSKEIIKAVYENIFDISDIPHIDDIENLTSSEIESIKNWANIQYERTSEIAEISLLPNSLDFGKTVIMKGVNGSEAYFSIDSNQVNPSEGDEEIINVQFSTGYGMPKNGYIKLTVGYLKFDEDGGASEGISDEIEYVYDSVLKELDAFIDEQTYLTEKDTQISESINNAISNVHKQI